jgi:L-alanine-DL-glutamate epimerase-like enolase superfamily enzyme
VRPRITDIETIELRVPGTDAIANAGIDWTCLVKVETDAGVYGTAEVTSVPSVIRAIVEAPAALTRARGLASLLLGQDPTEIALLWQRMYDYTSWHGRRGAVIHAIGALDIALWDILGKLEGKSVAQLLGGSRRQSVRSYATLYPTGTTSDALRRSLDAALRRGFRGFKICADETWRSDPDRVASLLGAARRHIGSDAELILEAVWVYHSAAELLPLMPIFREYRLAWLEAPLPLDDLEGHAALQGFGVAISAGDNALTTHHEFEAMMDCGHVDIIQPDIALAGGYSEVMRIADLADQRGRRLVPHGYKTSVTDAINSAFMSRHGRDDFIEYALTHSPLRHGLIEERFEPDATGRIPVADRPGLGITLRQEIIDRFRIR